jgi:hypothetical protein
MLVLARRHKSDGKRLNLGILNVEAGFSPAKVLGEVIVREGHKPQQVNVVEPLVSVTVKDDKTAVDALLYLTGHSNFKTVEG